MLFSFRPRLTRACPMITADRPMRRAGRSTKSALLEALEPRLVPSTLGGSPPVAMLSLTEADSRSVTIAYSVDQATEAGQPLRFGIYRSSDGQFGTGDVPIDSWQAGPTTQGQAGRRWMMPASRPCAGHPSRDDRLARRPAPDPEKPYVLVVADPVSLGDRRPQQTASFRVYTIGIVTHGGIQDPSWKHGPPWELETAYMMKQRGLRLGDRLQLGALQSSTPGAGDQAVARGWRGSILGDGQPVPGRMTRSTSSSSATARGRWSTRMPSPSSRTR